VHAENILRNVNCADQSTKCCLKITAHIRASSSSLDLATKIINEPSALNYTTVTQISNKAICKQAIQISVFFKSLCFVLCSLSAVINTQSQIWTFISNKIGTEISHRKWNKVFHAH